MPEMIKNDESAKLDTLAEQLAQKIMDDPEITEFCHRHAGEQCDPANWTEDETESNDDTIQSRYYWEVYSSLQTRIVAQANLKLMRYVR